MLKLASSVHGESRIRLLRVVRRGDRHDPRELDVAFRFEGDFARAFTEGASGGVLPGEAIKNLVHRTVRETTSEELEVLGLALCDRVMATHSQISRARVEIVERAWARLDAGARTQLQAFTAAGPERKLATVTSNGSQVSVMAGIEELTLMRTAGFVPGGRAAADDGGSDGLPRLVVASVDARWSYTSPDVTFRPYRHGVRAALVETFARDASRSVQHTLYAMADVVLSSYEEIADVTLALRERPYRPADLFDAGIENPDELFIAAEEPLGVVEVTVERA